MNDLCLNDILEAAAHIAAFLWQIDFEDFRQSELVQSAVVQKLAIIGEASARISDDVKRRYPQIPWPQIVAFRNILIHAYFGIDWTKSGGQPRLTAEKLPPFWQQSWRPCGRER